MYNMGHDTEALNLFESLKLRPGGLVKCFGWTRKDDFAGERWVREPEFLGHQSSPLNARSRMAGSRASSSWAVSICMARDRAMMS